ncbi:MAG: hypothetical protein WBQ68_04355 [Terriglobales bacterium]
MRYLPVNIYNNGDVDNEVVNLSLSNGDVVIWQNPHHYDFTVTFPNSPFQAGSTFTVPARGSANSGALKPSVQPGQVYDYGIQNVELALASDPGIKIKP